MKSYLSPFPLLGLAILLGGGLGLPSARADQEPTEDEKKKIAEAMPDKPFAKPDGDRRILIVSRTNGFRHKSIPHGKLALDVMGQETGAYKAVVSDDRSHFEKEALKQFDAIVLLNVSQDFLKPTKQEQEGMTPDEVKEANADHERLISNLVEYVKMGGGLVGIHAATDACYKHPEYPEMIGGLFDGHPWNAGNRVVIDVEDPDHELNRVVFGKLAEFELIEEIYQFKEEPYSRERLRILLALDEEKSDQVDPKRIKRKDGDFPVAWVQQYDRGRVFYSALGHNAHIYWDTMILKHYLAGIQFAIGDLKADTTPSAQVKR